MPVTSPARPQSNDGPALTSLTNQPTSHHGRSRSSWGLPDSHGESGVQARFPTFVLSIRPSTTTVPRYYAVIYLSKETYL